MEVIASDGVRMSTHCSALERVKRCTHALHKFTTFCSNGAHEEHQSSCVFLFVVHQRFTKFFICMYHTLILIYRVLVDSRFKAQCAYLNYFVWLTAVVPNLSSTLPAPERARSLQIYRILTASCQVSLTIF